MRTLSPFQIETLRSEMLRTTILAVFFLSGALFFTVFSLTFPAEFNQVFQGTLQWWLPPIFFSIVATYLLGVR
ncbi:MAG TPA: hypothetical protein PKA91_12340, partial [Leptospiraceae bacterium]|nr:hypothetical protein [Leptospiraceae bacterium]